MKIGFTYKLSSIEWDMYRLNASKEQVIKNYIKQKKNVKKIIDSHERQQENIDKIVLKTQADYLIDMIELHEERHKGKIVLPEVDILFVMGGDNFFQICTHYFPNSYLVGINSDPKTSEGVLLNFTPDEVYKKIDSILGGNFKYENWTTIETKLNDEKVAKSTCTVALSIKATDMMSRYLLETEDRKEEQKSTGILFSCGAGSGDNAWYRNAGLYLPMVKSGLYESPTKQFDRELNEIRTLTREPLGGENCKYKMLNERIKEGEELNLMYWANDPSELSIDSVTRYDVKQGDNLKIRVSDEPLKVVK